MADYTIENREIRIGINRHGAEMVSLMRKSDGREYMWSGDAQYWSRVSPVLFPFIGKLKNQSYRYNDREYTEISQHGYARDYDFEMVEKSEDVIWFELHSDDSWKEHYPFDFLLRIGYRLEGSKVHVMWTVRNDGGDTMYFSIGAHPAFLAKKGTVIDFHIPSDQLVCGQLDENGLLLKNRREFALDRGKLKYTTEVFEKDALIIDSRDIHTVSLEDEDGAYLQMQFDTPQLGIWSPAGMDAPFVCIEPWFGRADRVDFDGTLEQREYGNSIDPGHSFNKEYVIEIPG